MIIKDMIMFLRVKYYYVHNSEYKKIDEINTTKCYLLDLGDR